MLLLDPTTREAVAAWCGWTSIACWLGAQLPQVIKNWQQGNCDGLALPFLINWLMGDVTNLIGCILTDQLPFQTYLATYFCFVDVALVSQFFYYRRSSKPPSILHRHVSPRASLVLPPAARSHSVGHLASVVPTSPLPPSAGLPRSASGRGRRRAPIHSHTMSELADPAEALYAAALDVARAAERVSRRSNSSRPRTRHAATAPPDDHMPLRDSFHSELSASSMDEDAQHDRERMTQSTGALGLLDARGRSLTRVSSLGTPQRVDTLDSLHDLHGSMLEVRRPNASRSQSRAAARGSGRRAAGVAFMSLGLLFWTVPERLGNSASKGVGRVVPNSVMRNSAESAEMAESGSSPSDIASARVAWQPPWPLHPLPLPVGQTYIFVEPLKGKSGSEPGHKPRPPRKEPVDIKELIGRISAWCCTTLYLTSRLPQIWKNFQRKSVEGLSILLFLFAFLGNTFYVLSLTIAPAPPGQQSHHLLRALPYLLGSGGTLVFDLTIMIQAAMYGAAPPATPLHAPRHRRTYSYGTMRRRRHTTEEGALGISFGGNPERRPLLHSPSRAVTEPRPGVARTHSGPGASNQSSTASIPGLWMRSSESPRQSPTTGA